ncbi:MAG: hypothetical protein ACFHW5_16695 [Verrucomicrobiota bacterium]
MSRRDPKNIYMGEDQSVGNLQDPHFLQPVQLSLPFALDEQIASMSFSYFIPSNQQVNLFKYDEMDNQWQSIDSQYEDGWLKTEVSGGGIYGVGLFSARRPELAVDLTEDGGLHFRYQVETGFDYTIEYSDQLNEPQTFIPLAEGPHNDGEFVLPRPTEGFFRVILSR